MPKKVKTPYQQVAMAMIRRSLLMLFLLSTAGLSAQETDHQLRFTPSLSYKIDKKWKASFDYRIAFDQDISAFRSSMFQPALEYKIMKGLTVELGYRFITAFSHDSHRLMATVQYRHKMEDFTLVSSTRYQFSTRSFDADFMSNYKEPSQYIRQKFTLDYNVPHSKLSVYVAPELFLKLDSNPLAFHRMRYHIGADYNLKHGNSLGLALFYEDVFKVTKDDRFVYNIKYSLSIDELIKKKKKKEKKEKSEG
jgi:hypothetical protein